MPTGYGRAINYSAIINSTVPVVGAVVITNEGWTGHLAIVAELVDGKMRLDEANYTHCTITKDRWIDIGDPAILGYYI